MDNEKVEFDNPKLNRLMYVFMNNPDEEMLNTVLFEVVENAKFISVANVTEVPVQGEDGKETGETKPLLNIPFISNEDNENYFPAFTNYNEFCKWNKDENPSIMVFTFDDYAKLVLERNDAHGFVINPYNQNFALSKEMVKILNDRKVKVKELLEKSKELSTHIFVGDPMEYPTELVESIENYMESEDSIKNAWIKLMYHNGEQGYLVVYESDKENDYVADEIAYAARPFLKKRFIEVLPYSSEFAKKALEDSKPFYRKGGGFKINFLKFFK